MKILGHPVHLMLVHFPSALFPMECVCYMLFYFTGRSSFGDASFYAMTAGVVLGWMAVLFGALDLAKIPSEKTNSIKKALIHGSINATVVIIYSVLMGLIFKKYPELPNASGVLLITKCGLVLFMITGNFIGGSLVLKDKIGTEE